jgi:predicted RNase H-like HicB family nuclease
MKPEYTAVVVKDGDWYVAWCPEIKGANGQGKTRTACLKDLAASVETMLAYYRAEALKSAPPDAEHTSLALA